MKIYTKTGDAGDTGLFGAPRVRKDAPRIEAIGSVDELNSILGLVRVEQLAADVDALLERIQHELFDFGAELSTPDPEAHRMRNIGQVQIAALERAIDAAETGLEPLRQFILPGGVRSAALLHLARTVCRRVERRLITLTDISAEPVSAALLIYLNRLSDLLFVLARKVNQSAGVSDITWQHVDERGS